MGVAVGSLGIPGSTGNFSVSSLAFEPVAVVLFSQWDHLGPYSLTLGCATADDEQWAVWTGTATELSGYNARKREGRTDSCAFHRNSVDSAIQWQASFVSFESDGFTLNLDVRNFVSGGEGGSIYYMAIGGDHISEAHAGTFTNGASTGTTAVTAPGFTPTCAMMAHMWSAFDTGILSSSILGIGVTDGVNHFSSETAMYAGEQLGGNHIYRTDAVACSYSKNVPATFRMELDSWDANGFTVDVVDAWISDMDHGYLAINADGAVVGNGVQPDSNTSQTYDTPGLLPEGVFFTWAGVDTPSTSGSNSLPLRPGVGAGTIAQERMSSGIARSSAPAGVWTSDGYQISTESMGFWGVGDGIAGGSNGSQASANLSAVADDTFELTWSNVADTNDRVFGWLALPGELTFIPQIYRILRFPHTVA